MKYLVLFISLLSVTANADMAGFNFGFGQNTRPFYGVDYEINEDLPYFDISISGNRDYVQPQVSLGLQFEHLNFGIAGAVSASNYSKGGFTGAFSFGPEAGYMQNLSKLVYVKENNSYMGFGGKFNLTSTVSLGLNL